VREIVWGRYHRLSGLKSLMDAPPEYKLRELKATLDELPNRDVVLVGDSGQHDPEVYSETARRFPGQIRRIFIRDVTGEGPESPRYQKDFQGLPRELWQVFRDPADIRDAIPN